MERIDLYLGEATTLTFGVDVHGVSVVNLSPRLVIASLHPGMNVAVTGIYENGKATFDLPILSNILTPGIHKASLELILEKERFFNPLNIEIDFIGNPVAEATFDTRNTNETVQINNNTVITSRLIRKEAKKTEEELIVENITLFSNCKNPQSLCFEYSKRVLLREGYIPLNAGEVISKLDLVCQMNFNCTFAEHSATIRK